MAVNVFKKKPLYQTQNQTTSSQPIQGSGYGSNYASNQSNYKASAQPIKASNYSTQNTVGNLLKQPVVTPKQPVAQAMPKKPLFSLPKPVNITNRALGVKQPQMSTQNMSIAPKPAPQMSSYIAPKPQMSVETNANLNRLKTQVPAPQPIPQQDPTNQWMDYLSKTGSNRISTEEQRRADQMDFLRQQGELTNKQLLDQVPVAEENFNQYKTNTEASISDLLAGGERQKSQASDYYGDAQRQAAQSRREVQGETSKKFANLGTIDSRGEGSFQQATENADSDFNRYTQQNLKAKAEKLSEIDATIGQAERDARATIYQEEQKMNQLKRDIQYAVANNDLTTAQGLKEAYTTSQNLIYDIEDSLANAKYQFGLEQQKLENEINSTSTANLSQEFLSSGKPMTEADMEFIVRNPEGATAYSKMIAPGGGKQTEKQMAYTAAGNIAQNALTKLNSGSVSTGLGNKALGKLGETFGTNSDEQQSYRSDIAAMRTAIQNALLGANMAPQEMEQIMAAIPQYSDAPNIVRAKLESLITNLPILAGSGQQVSGQIDQAQLDQILASLGN